MINILIPSAGKSMFYKDSYFPKLMYEISGKTMLERVVENFKNIKDYHFIFIFDHKECVEFHIDESARILTEPNVDIIVLENGTGGALCTCLMAIKFIDNDKPLVIANCDQIIEVDYNEVVSYFQEESDAAGLITFENIHPRWSYARVLNDKVTEVAEKRPLSKHAIAGVYYFEKGKYFIEAAKKAILKDSCFNGKFYISSSINEIILQDMEVGYFEIDRKNYHSFYSPEKIKEYETRLKTDR